MANIPIKPWELPPDSPLPNASIVGGNGSVVQKYTPAQIVDVAVPLASQGDAETGTGNSNRMSALRVKQAIDAQAVLPNDLASPDPGKGASLVGIDGGGTVQDALNVLTNPYLHKKSVPFTAPMAFVGFQEIIDTYELTNIYPQGFTVDERANQLFIMYSAVGSPAGKSYIWVVVYDLSTGSQVRYFSAGYGTANEGGGVWYDDANGKRYLYARNASDESAGTPIGLFDITTLPANGSILTATSTKDVGLRFQYCFSNGRLWVETSATPLGSYHRRNYWQAWDPTLSTVLTDMSVPAWAHPEDGMVAALPKAQSFFVGGSFAYSGLGPLWRQGDVPEPTPPGYYCGVNVCGLDGSLLYGTAYEPSAFRALLGDHINQSAFPRLENEGVYAWSDGTVWTLWATGSTTGGGTIAFVEEFSKKPDAIDFSSAARALPSQPSQWLLRKGRTLTGATDGAIAPLTGAELKTVEAIAEYMCDYEIPFATFGTSHLNAITFRGATLPSNRVVEMRLGRGDTVGVWYNGVTGSPLYFTVTDAGVIVDRSNPMEITGSPEGAVTAIIGRTAINLSGGAGQTFWVKESGTGNTGWVAK